MSILNTVYQNNNLSSIISKADYYVLAGNTAIQYATTWNSKKANPKNLDNLPYTLLLPFRYGRQDHASCNDKGFLPLASFAWSDIFLLFNGRFGMSVNEVRE